MNDWIEKLAWAGIVVIVLLVLVFIIYAIGLPFFIVGWSISIFIDTAASSYWTHAMVGFAACVVIALIRALLDK